MRAKSSSTEGAAVSSPASAPDAPPTTGVGPVGGASPLPRSASSWSCGSSARAEAELVGHALRRGPRLLVGAVQLGQDPVDPVAHPVDRGGHLVPGRPQLLNLDPEAAPPCGQVGQHPAPRLLDLVEEGAALVLGTGDDRLARGNRLGNDPLTLHPSLLFGVGHQQLHLDDPLGRRCLGALLQLVDLALRLAQQGGRPFLGLDHDPGRLLMGVAQDLGAVLAQGGREGGLVHHRVGGPLLGLGQGGPQLFLARLERFEAAGDRLQVGTDLVGVEAPADHGEGVLRDVAGGDPGR